MPEAINISDIQLFNLLKPKLGEKEAEQLVNFVKLEAQSTAKKQFEYVTKDIQSLRDEFYQNFPNKEDLVREVSLSKEYLLKEINQSKVDMIKWMFGFWFTIVLLLLANWFLKH